MTLFYQRMQGGRKMPDYKWIAKILVAVVFAWSLTAGSLYAQPNVNASDVAKDRVRDRAQNHRQEFRKKKQAHRKEFQEKKRAHRQEFREKKQAHRKEFREKKKAHRQEFREKKQAHRQNFRDRRGNK